MASIAWETQNGGDVIGLMPVAQRLLDNCPADPAHGESWDTSNAIHSDTQTISNAQA